MVTNMLLPAEEPRRVGLRVGTHVGSAGGDHSDEHHMEMEPSLSENNCPSQTQGFPLPCEFAGGGLKNVQTPALPTLWPPKTALGICRLWHGKNVGSLNGLEPKRLKDSRLLSGVVWSCF